MIKENFSIKQQKLPILLTALATVLLFSACATPTNHYDPLEPINRFSFQLNDKLDRYALKPIAKAYSNYVPGPIHSGVANFTGNIGGISSTAGNIMEGKIKNAFQDMGRIIINTLFGLFGIVDWATDLDLPAQDRSIGKALGRWGIGTGPYLVLPLLGPTTVRDSTDIIFEWTANAPHHFHGKGRKIYAMVNGIDTRASLLPYEAALDDQLIFDRYAYIRDSYLQKRYNDVYYGDPPKPLALGDSSIDNDPGIDEQSTDNHSDTSNSKNNTTS